MSRPGAEAALMLAGQRLAIEYFARIDRGDLDGAVDLYAEDAVFLGARGQRDIRKTMARGLAAHGDRRSRHVIANVRSSCPDPATVVVEFTALAYSLDADPPLAPRSILDQEMRLRGGEDGSLVIVEHLIPGYRTD